MGRSRYLKNDVTEDAHFSGYRELHSMHMYFVPAYTKTVFVDLFVKSGRAGRSLKTFLMPSRFILTKFQPKPTHLDLNQPRNHEITSFCGFSSARRGFFIFKKHAFGGSRGLRLGESGKSGWGNRLEDTGGAGGAEPIH